MKGDPVGAVDTLLPTGTKEALDHLASMSEIAFQSEIVEPLLRCMGLREVRDNSGSSEYGKDLIAIGSNTFRDPILIAVQIKKFRVTGKVGSTRSFGRLLDQLRQSAEEEVPDPVTNTNRVPDRVYFITPYAIPMSARKAFASRLKKASLANIEIVDGIRILDLIRDFMPARLATFGVNYHYRSAVASRANIVGEAQIAFGMSNALVLDDIFVDINLVRIAEQEDPQPTPIPSSSLHDVRKHLLVLGGAGCGKTTLLRRLAQQTARGDKRLPVLLPLMSVHKPSYNGLIDALVRELSMNGFTSPREDHVDSRDFVAGLDSGVFCVFLDGLDEAGSRANELLSAIKAFADKHKACQVVLSSRDTFGNIIWDKALSLRLDPFTKQQLIAFVDRWYSAEPTSRDLLLKWLVQNPRMRSAARTPLIAAVLCSLFQVRADMPTTEIELYDRRFELLLGKWEQAKDIPPLSSSIRKRYRHFLLSYAFQLHKSEERSDSRGLVRSLADRCYVPAYHGTADALIDDCVHRGVLQLDPSGRLSFGHLSYQEHLTAHYLAVENPLKFIWGKIDSAWWKNTLDFYASIKLDITPLLVHGSRNREGLPRQSRLRELIDLAPLTDAAAVARIFKNYRFQVRVDSRDVRG